MHFGKTVPSVRTGIEIHRFLLWKRTDRFLKLGNRNFIRTDRIGLGRTDARPIRNASYPSLDQLVKGICSCYLSEEAQAHELDVPFFLDLLSSQLSESSAVHSGATTEKNQRGVRRICLLPKCEFRRMDG
jgi:hypothetical protein